MTFDQLIEKIINTIKQNPEVLKKIENIATKVYNDAYNQAAEQHYCLTFNIPEKEVLKLMENDFNITSEEINDVFEKELGFPKNANMYGSPYYQFLLALFYAFKKMHDTKYSKIVLFLIFIKVWNGRKYKYIKYCNKQIMDYILAKKVSKRNLVAKYKNPIDLIINYFVPTIEQKYTSYILNDYKKIKLLFAQMFGRIDQLFNNVTKTGLANIYFNVYNSGEALKTTSLLKSDGEEITLVDIESKNAQTQKIINIVINSIFLNKPNYPAEIINYINQKTKVSKRSIETIAKELHNPKYKDIYEELFVILLNRINIQDEATLCKYKTNIFNIIDRYIITSKHNRDVEEFKSLIINILDDILQRLVNKTLDQFSAKISLIRVVSYLLAYNLIYTLCQFHPINQ